MNNHPITRTIVTESTVALRSRTATLDGLRDFVRDTQSMDGMARVRIAYSDGITTTEPTAAVFFLRVVQQEKA